jgi:hypothetical protein
MDFELDDEYYIVHFIRIVFYLKLQYCVPEIMP